MKRALVVGFVFGVALGAYAAPDADPWIHLTNNQQFDRPTRFQQEAQFSFIDAGVISAATLTATTSAATTGKFDAIDAGVSCVVGESQVGGTFYANNGIEIPTNKKLYFDGPLHGQYWYFDGTYLRTASALATPVVYLGASGIVQDQTLGYSPVYFRGYAASNGSGIANQFGNQIALTTAGDKIASFTSDALVTERAYVDYRGVYNGIMGTSTSFARAPGVASVNITATGNGADTTEDDLHSYTIPANAFSANLKGIRYTASGTGVSTANATTLKCYFGHASTLKSGTAIISQVLTTSQANTWRVEAEVIRTGAGAQIAFAKLVHTGASGVITVTDTRTTPAGTETGAMLVGCTGQRGTASTANSVVQTESIVEFIN